MHLAIIVMAVVALYIAVYQFTHFEPKTSAPREKNPRPRRRMTRRQIVAQFKRDFEEDVRIIRGMPLQQDEKEAAIEEARRKLIWRTHRVLK